MPTYEHKGTTVEVAEDCNAAVEGDVLVCWARESLDRDTDMAAEELIDMEDHAASDRCKMFQPEEHGTV